MRRATIAFFFAAVILAGAAISARAQRPDSFPHLAHAKVFPACTGCHSGVVSGDVAALFPDPSTCSGCHDGMQNYEGRVLRRVAWRGARYRATNLAFSHTEHARETNTVGSTQACVTCHQRAGTVEWMAVAGAAPAACLACHEHAAPAHLADEANCRTCHVPLAQATALTAGEIAAFPQPASHEATDFLFAHAPAESAAVARCAVCHTQESCARCHIDPAATPSIAALGRNAAVALMLAGKGARYPVPATHAAADFTITHGAAARGDPATCSGCHAQASCKTCHLQIGARATIAKLPVAKPGGAQGVQLRSAPDLFFALLSAVAFRAPATTPGRVRPELWAVRVHTPGFARKHQASASSNAPNCGSCHQKSYCADCHDGAGKLRYHPADFVQGHGAQAYGREQDCAACHNTEAFCLTCHQNLGLGSTGIRNGAVHNQSANWLIDHGQAARLSLPNCVSCHKQADCIRCHSTLGWGVNPHGPNFDADRMSSANMQICYYCHVGNPVGKRTR